MLSDGEKEKRRRERKERKERVGGGIGRAKERERERGRERAFTRSKRAHFRNNNCTKSDKGDFVVKRTCIAQ